MREKFTADQLCDAVFFSNFYQRLPIQSTGNQRADPAGCLR
jgi:hypothetical protein